MKLTTNPDTSPLGLKLTEIMNRYNIDDQQLAEASDLGYSTVRGLRRLPAKKLNPEARTFDKLAAGLSQIAGVTITPDHLKGGAVEPKAAPPSGVNGKFDAKARAAAMRELEKLPEVAAYKALLAA